MVFAGVVGPKAAADAPGGIATLMISISACCCFGVVLSCPGSIFKNLHQVRLEWEDPEGFFWLDRL
jgi:hypothetical protein